MKILICIPVFNRIEYTLSCLESISKQPFKDIITIVCDDGSTDGTTDKINKYYPETIVVQGNGNLWWTGGINECIKKALALSDDDDFIYTLNNDTILGADTFQHLLEAEIRFSNEVIIGTLNLFYENPGRIENSSFRYKNIFSGYKRVTEFGEDLNSRSGLEEVDGLSGKGVLIPVKVFHKIGIYDQKKFPHYHADLEFIIRAKRAGFRVFISFDAKLFSHQNLSGIGSSTSEKPSLRDFVKSFFVIKSTHHLPSVWRLSKIIYGKFFIFGFIKHVLFIFLGFTKRFFKYYFSK